MIHLSPILYVVISTLFFLSCATLVKHLFFSRRKYQPPIPPGPWGLPIVGNLLSVKPELHSYFSDLARLHGPIYSLRLGSKLGIIISSPALAREVLKDHDLTFANRDVPAAALAASYNGADIAWAPYGAEWRLLRKICVRDMLSAANLDAMYDIRRREIRRMIRLISGRAGQPVNVREQIFLTALNVVTGMLWGGTMKDGESLGREFLKAMTELTGLLGARNISDFFPGLAWIDLQGVVKKMRVCANKFDEIFERVIDQRLRLNDEEMKENDFLSVLLKLKDSYAEDVGGGGGGGGAEKKVVFSLTHIKALFIDIMVGGTDTSSKTIEFAMAEILNKPSVLHKIHHELDIVVGKNTTLEEHHIQKLPYLRAVMKETLRIHPILPLLVPHTPSESCIIGGYTIPKGSRVFINVWAIHRDPLIWVDPMDFNPDRFLNVKMDFSGTNFNYFPFGSGRRSCAGIPMAERMVLFSLASLLHSFDWRSLEGEKIDLGETFGIVFSKRVPLVMIPEPRLVDSDLYE